MCPILVHKSLSKKGVIHKSYDPFLSKDPHEFLCSKDGHILVEIQPLLLKTML